jgi:hypothetical protein
MIRKSNIYYFITTILLFGCSHISPHENFKDALHDSIGRNIDKVPSYEWPHKEDLISSKILLSGMMENRYQYGRNCILIFEIDRRTRKIEKSNFEGSETDCVINP